MITISIQNATAQIQGLERPTFRQLRSLISFRERLLPPIPIQGTIRSFFERRARSGVMRDYQTLFSSATGDDLRELGWDEAKLTPQMMEGVIRQKGTWDGWRTLISLNGYFGAGLLPHVQRALTVHLGLRDEQIQLFDRRAPPTPNPLPGMPSLFSFQQEALDAWIEAGGRGVVDLPPRSGKTHIAIAAVKRLGIPTLIVVPRKVLVQQTVERFREHFPAHEVVGITGGRPTQKKLRAMAQALVWVATPPTAAGPKPKERGERRPGITNIHTRQMLIVDEFHHSAADTWQDISRAAINAYYRLGLTGTHFRADGRDLAMHAILSRKVYTRSVSDMVKLGRLVPAAVAVIRVPGAIAAEGYEAYQQGISANDIRNGLAAEACRQLIAAGKRVLVLTKEIAHSEALAAAVGPSAVQVDGARSDDLRAILDRLEAREISCVVGTSVIGEGVDVPAADALVYVAGGRSRVKVVQDYFRVLTANEGKSCGVVVDFGDLHHEKLLYRSAERLALYRSEPAFSATVIDHQDFSSWLAANG